MSEDVRDRRVIYVDGQMTVEALLVNDDMPQPDGDCYTAEDYAAFRRGEWEYMGVVAVVTFAGVEIAREALYGVEHGTMAETEADAFAWTPAVVHGDTITGGSALWDVTSEAVNAAWHWVRAVAGKDGWLSAEGTPIGRLQRLAEPINPALIEEEHGLALRENAQWPLALG